MDSATLTYTLNVKQMSTRFIYIYDYICTFIFSMLCNLFLTFLFSDSKMDRKDKLFVINEVNYLFGIHFILKLSINICYFVLYGWQNDLFDSLYFVLSTVRKTHVLSFRFVKWRIATSVSFLRLKRKWIYICGIKWF